VTDGGFTESAIAWRAERDRRQPLKPSPEVLGDADWRDEDAANGGPHRDGAEQPRDDGAPPHDGNDADRDASDEARELRDIARRLVSAASLAHETEPTREWVVDEIISADNLTLLTGEGGGGKTTAMLQLAAAMQTDGYWLNLRVKQGAALFVSSEDELKDLSMSLRAILKIEGKSLAHCPNLHILSLADRDACMASAPSKLASLTATPLWRALEATVERLKPRALFLDALADMFGGEENFRRHARSFIVILKRLAFRHRMAVILIAHPSLAGINSGSGLSGSTDWHNGPRGRLFLATPDSDEALADKSRRDLIVKKVQHSGAEGTVFHLRRKDGAFICEGREGGSTPYDRAATASKAEAVFLALLNSFEGQRRTVSPKPGANYAPAVFAKEPDVQGVKKEALARAMSNLLKENRIHIDDLGPPSRKVQKLSPGPSPPKNDGAPAQ
jgi:RecA-family ATPase